MKEEIENKLNKIKDLTTLPVVAHNVIQLTQSPKSSALQVGDAIAQDPALSSKVLRVANSAFYGFPQKIATISSAIVILGFANIRNIVLTASIANMVPLKGGSGHFDRLDFWKHSLACGITSKLLAKRSGMKNVEEVFLWGLLHDLGKIVLDEYFKEEFACVISLAEREGILIKYAEEEIFGVDHAAVGAIVGEKWNLPQALLKVIRFHHNPPLANESMRMVALVHLSDVLCRAIGMGDGGDSKIPLINADSWKLFKCNKQLIKNLFSEMEQEIANATDFLSFLE